MNIKKYCKNKIPKLVSYELDRIIGIQSDNIIPGKILFLYKAINKGMFIKKTYVVGSLPNLIHK